MMDRVLSYQTAMRASSDSSGFDIRQYISKRTCISLTMSIAFVVLIFGFLLGKFTSDRNHLIKENYRRQSEITHRPVRMQNEVDKIINSVIEAVRHKLSTNFKEQYYKEHEGANQYVTMVRNNFTECIGEIKYESVEEDLEDFVKNLLKNYYDLFVKCAKDLRQILLDD